jgi:hypothetical protein
VKRLITFRAPRTSNVLRRQLHTACLQRLAHQCYESSFNLPCKDHRAPTLH